MAPIFSRLPTTLLRFAVIALFLSMSMNIVSLSFRVAIPHTQSRKYSQIPCISTKVLTHLALVWPSGYVSKDHPSSLPIRIRPAALIIQDTERYPLNSSKDWETLTPMTGGGGFIRMPMGDGRHSYFAVSMYHQIHCLTAMRRYFDDILSGKNITELNIVHSTHCLSYLGQNFLCAADTSLEPTHPERRSSSSKLTYVAVEEGVVHRCRDWTQVRSWVESNHALWPPEDYNLGAETGPR